MTKKDYILKILDALMGSWPLARGLKILVEGDALDENTVQKIVDIFAKTIDEIQDSKDKEKLIKSKNALEKLKQIEQEQHLRDEKSLGELDKMIEAI